VLLSMQTEERKTGNEARQRANFAYGPVH